jgi:Uma2 family endonuclease
MSPAVLHTPLSEQTLYPDSDGQPMAENTLQYDWIVRLVTNLRRLLKDRPAFVAGDLLWYPVQVDAPPVPCQAPDVLVALGRSPGYRGSYKQWEEDNIAPQVVFEIISPSNTATEMLRKQNFYSRYGVLEVFFYNPENQDFWGLVRSHPDQGFSPLTLLQLPWVSPLLNIRFALGARGLEIFYPNGEPFKEPGDFADERDRAFAKLRELGIDPEQL